MLVSLHTPHLTHNTYHTLGIATTFRFHSYITTRPLFRGLATNSTPSKRSILTLALAQILYFDKGQGRFLTFDDELGLWYEIDDAQAMRVVQKHLDKLDPSLRMMDSVGRWKHDLGFGVDSRPVTNRLHKGVLYFPTKSGVTYLISATGGDIRIGTSLTSSIASDIKECYFQESHLMEVDIKAEYVDKINDISKDPRFVEARGANDK